MTVLIVKGCKCSACKRLIQTTTVILYRNVLTRLSSVNFFNYVEVEGTPEGTQVVRELIRLVVSCCNN